MRVGKITKNEFINEKKSRIDQRKTVDWMHTLPESPLSKYILQSHNKQLDWSATAAKDVLNHSDIDRSIVNIEMLTDIQTNLMSRFAAKSIKPVEIPTKRIHNIPNLSDDYYLNVVDYERKGDLLVAGLGSDLWASWNLFDLQSNVPRTRHLLKFPINEQITSVSVSCNTLNIIVGTSKSRLLLTSLKPDGSIVRNESTKATLHCNRISSLHWRDENVYSSAGKDRQIIIHDIRQSTPISKLMNAHDQEIVGLKWSNGSGDEYLLASGGNDNALMIWDLRRLTRTTTGDGGDPLWEIRRHSAAVKALAWSPHQRSVLASGGGSADKRLMIWNVAESEEYSDDEETAVGPKRIACKDTGSQVCALSWSNDQQLWSAHGFSDNECIQWTIPSMQRRAIMRGHTRRVLYLAGPSREGMMASVSSDLTIRIWDALCRSETY